MGDARRYDSWATEIASGDVMGRDVFYQAPLYPYFLGALYRDRRPQPVDCARLSGRHWSLAPACCSHSPLAACTRSELDLIAGFGLAVYAPAVFFDGLIQKSALDLFLVSLSLWIISGLVDKPTPPSRWFWLGIAMGALALTRENALIFVPAILLWPPGRSEVTHRQRLLNAGVLVLGLTARTLSRGASQPDRRRRMASDDVAIRPQPLHRQQSQCRRNVFGLTRRKRDGRVRTPGCHGARRSGDRPPSRLPERCRVTGFDRPSSSFDRSLARGWR